MSWNLPIFSLRKNVSGIHTFVESVIVRYLILSERRGRKIDNSVSELRMFKTSNIAPILKKTYIWEIFPSNLRVSINLSLFVSILPPNPISNKIEMQMTATTTTTTTSPSPSWKYDGRMGKRRRLRRVVDAVRAPLSLSPRGDAQNWTLASSSSVYSCHARALAASTHSARIPKSQGRSSPAPKKCSPNSGLSTLF